VIPAGRVNQGSDREINRRYAQADEKEGDDRAERMLAVSYWMRIDSTSTNEGQDLSDAVGDRQTQKNERQVLIHG